MARWRRWRRLANGFYESDSTEAFMRAVTADGGWVWSVTQYSGTQRVAGPARTLAEAKELAERELERTCGCDAKQEGT
jgi:hypothetical protein